MSAASLCDELEIGVHQRTAAGHSSVVDNERHWIYRVLARRTTDKSSAVHQQEQQGEEALLAKAFWCVVDGFLRRLEHFGTYR